MTQVIVKEDGTGDYTSLAAAITASETDILIQGTWTNAETSTYTISSATTIETNGDAKHPGYVGSSPSHWRVRNTSGHTFTLSANLTLKNVDIGSQSTGASDELVRLNANSLTVQTENCLLWFNSRNSEQDIFYTNSRSDYTIQITNCIIWNAQRSVIDDFISGGTNTIEINSCTIYNVGYSTSTSSRSGAIGLNPSSSATTVCRVFNTLLHINTGASFTTTTNGTTTIICDRGVSNVSDLTSTGWDTETLTDNLLSHNWTDDNTKSSDGDWVIVEDITTAPYDFRLQDNIYNEAQDAHSDGSGASLTMPSTDIVGTSRSAPYCIGAHRIVSGVTPITRTVAGVLSFSGAVTRTVSYKRTVEGSF